MPEKELSPLLQVEHLHKSYGDRKVVDDLSFLLRPSEVVGLLGPNGAGKTTAFYMTIGLIQPEKGKILFRGQEMTHLPLHERARLGVGYLSQEPSVFRSLTVEENILCVLETLPLSKEQRKSRLAQLLAELHLEPLAKKKAGTLSGGERRRLEITRALATEPSLLLLDEPFANIDPIAIADVKKIILHLKRKGIAVFITDHNARELFSIVDRSYLIRSGKILIAGTVDEILANREARRSYFGDDFEL
jgi:lipopolysaccharide export system ATP-binding protein